MPDKIAFGRYHPADSPVHRLDPRVKLVAAIVYMASCLAVHDTTTLLLAGAAALACIALSRVPVAAVLRTIRPVAFFLLVTSLFNLVFVQTGAPLVEVWVVRITSGGVAAAALYTLRFLFLLLAGSLLMLTTTTIALSDAAEKLLGPLVRVGIPVRETGLVLSIALRFVPTLVQEAESIVAAQTARGADLEGKGGIALARACVPLVVPLFASALRHAENLGRAMDARCYGRPGRTRYHVLALKRRDWVAMAAAALYLVALAALCLAP